MLTMAGQIYNIMYQPPQVPATPSGETGVCNTETTSYTITAVPTANEYIWQLTPANSGTLTANGTQAQIVWNQLFTGVAKLSVSAVNECGSSPVSPQLSVTVSGIPTPEISGLNKLCINTTAAYFSSGAANSSYTWSVTGGEITSGAGTNYVTINWSSSGQGIVKLTETSAQGCTGNAADFFVEVSLCTDVETNLNNGGLSVFPNPASSLLQLELPASIEVYNLQVFSVTGDLVMNVAKPSGNYITLDVSNLANGVYSIKAVSTDFKLYSTKFIKK
jgi:hypothetical protein